MIVGFIKKHCSIIILLIMILLFPQALSTQAALNIRVIIAGFAVDYENGKYEVTAQTIVPSLSNQGGGEGAHIEVISGSGASIGNAVRQISYRIGKTASLEHMNMILLGESMMDKDLTVELDYFFRSNEVKEPVMLLAAEGSAREEIAKTKNLELGVASGIQKAYIYKEQSMNGIMPLLKDFFNNYYNKSESGIISHFKIEEEEAEKQESGGGSGGVGEFLSGSGGSDGGGGSGGEKPKARLQFLNKVSYFKKGIRTGTLETEAEIYGYILYHYRAKEGFFVLNNIEGDLYKDAQVTVSVQNKNINTKASFEKGVPVFTLNIIIDKASVVDIKPSENSKVYIQGLKDYTNKDVINAIKKEFRSYLEAAYNKAKSDNTDILSVANVFYAQCTREWKDYMEKLENKDDFLQNVKLKVKVHVRGTF